MQRFFVFFLKKENNQKKWNYFTPQGAVLIFLSPCLECPFLNVSCENQAVWFLIGDFSCMAGSRCSQVSVALRLWCEISGPQLWDRRSPVSHWFGASFSFSPPAQADAVYLRHVWRSLRQRGGVPLVLRRQLLNPPIQNVEREGNTNWIHVP